MRTNLGFTGWRETGEVWIETHSKNNDFRPSGFPRGISATAGDAFLLPFNVQLQ